MPRGSLFLRDIFFALGLTAAGMVGEKGQIVIPKEARTLFGVQPGDTLLFLGDEQMGIIVTKPEVIENAAMKIFEEMEREPK